MSKKLENSEVSWTENAQYDLEEIIEYIKTDSVEIARNIFFEIKEQCSNLSIFPESRRIVPELQHIGILKYKELIYKRWRIVYKVENERISSKNLFKS